jgi:hypothetical protein
VLALIKVKRDHDELAATLKKPLREIDRYARTLLDDRFRARAIASRTLLDLVVREGGYIVARGVEVVVTSDGLDTAIIDLSGKAWPSPGYDMMEKHLESVVLHHEQGVVAHRRRLADGRIT